MTAIAFHWKHYSKVGEYLLHQGAWWEWIACHSGGISKYKIHCLTHAIIDVRDERHVSYIIMKYGAHVVDYLIESFTERGIDSMSVYFDDDKVDAREYKHVDGNKYRMLK